MARRTRLVSTYVLSVTIAAGLVLLWSLVTLDLSTIADWWLAALVFTFLYVLGELFPIQLLGRTDSGELTASAAFGFALLLVIPLPAALLAIALGTYLGDQRTRTGKPFVRIVFNVAQITVAFAAAGAVLAVARGGASVLPQGDLPFTQIAILLPAGLLMYATNVLLVSLAIALDQGAPLFTVVRRDLAPFDLLTHLLLLSFAPVFLIVWEHSLPLMPLLIVAIVATYRATKAAVSGQHDSRHDSLTGLPNRRLLDERLQELRDAGDGKDRFAVMVMDLDGFKNVNDAFGHEVGDHLLEQVALRLSQVDRIDTIARLGGDEFALVVRGLTTGSELRELGEHVIQRVTLPYEINGLPLQVGSSLGIAVYGDHGEDVHALMRRADSAMYAAKRADGGVRLASESEERRGPGRLSLVGELEGALERDELRLDYQPQFGLHTGAIVGLEALLRWDHPIHGTVGPDRFISTAEHTELLPALTRYVVERACADARDRRAAGFTAPMSVNISARDLLDTRLPRDIADLLVRYDVHPADLTLELTESALLADPERATQVLHELMEHGIGLAMDDFGTGYASLATIRDLPLSEVKIDRSFVRAMDESVAGSRIVRAIIELAADLQLRVVAEGIERPSELTTLAHYGCDVGQGFLLARPLNTTALHAFLSDHQREATSAPAPMPAFTPLPTPLRVVSGGAR